MPESPSGSLAKAFTLAHEIVALDPHAGEMMTHKHRLAKALLDLRTSIEEVDRVLMEQQQPEDSDGFIAYYTMPTGPWHRLIAKVRS